MGCKTSFVDMARACTTSLVQCVVGRGLGISFPYGLIAGSAGRVCAIAAACHVEIYMTINATEACVKVITVARPAMSALVFLFLCRAASWPPRLSNTTFTESRTMDHEPHSRISVHMDGQEAAAPDKHRIQGGNAPKTTKKEAQEQRV